MTHISLIAAMTLAAAVPLPAVEKELNFPSGMNVFTLQEPVRFSAGTTPELTIVDNLGKSVSKKAGKEALFDFGPMPAGYYRILAGQKEIGNFTVTLPPEAYPNDRNTAIGLDYAMNTAHLPLPGPALRRELERNARMARKAGVRRVRERFRANQEITRNADGSFTIDPKGRTMLTLGIDHAAGLAVCAVSQWTPNAVNRDRHQKKTPEKLTDTYALYHAIGKAWGPFLEGIELGNEIDLRAFYEGTAGEYAAYAKAASLALRKAAPGLLVIQSSFARPALHLKEALEENGVRPYSDRFNYHVYGEIGRPMHDYARYILARETHPRSWCTETGCDIGQWKWNRPGIEDFPPEQSRQIARSIGPVYAENLAAGADAVYFFYWRYGAEFSIGSILDKQYRATERYAALATVNRMLGNAIYRGSLITGDIRMHRFDNGHGGNAMLLWNAGTDTKMKVGLRGNYELVHYTGETIARGKADDTLELVLKKETPVYLRADQFSGRFADLRRTPPQEKEKAAAPAVIAELRPADGTGYDNSLAAFQLRPGESTPVKLTLHNFSDREFRGRIALKTTGQWRIEPAATLLAAAPGKSAEAAFRITAPTRRDGGILPGSLRASAPGVSPAAIRFALDPAAVAPREVKPAFQNLNSGRWSCGGDRSMMQFQTAPGETGPRFRIDFTAPGNRMFWPELNQLPDRLTLLDWGGWDAVRITLRMKRSYPGTWFMLTCTEQNGARYASARLTADTEGEHQLLFPFSGFTFVTEGSVPDAPLFSFDPDRIRALGFGSNNFNSMKLKNTNYSIEYEITAIDLIRY